MGRRAWVLLGFLATALAVTAVAWAGLARARAPIKVGLLHSLTGPMAISEAAMIDAEVMALEEINARQGLLGRRVEWVIADGRSDPAAFASEAQRLIDVEKVSAIFGCWTSASRKGVKAVVERAGHLLVYAVAYEGLEQSPNIVYCGAAPNQQIIPTVKWSRDALGAKTYFLIGSDSVWPHAVNAIVKDQLTALGAKSVGEVYLSAGDSGVDAAVAAILAAKPDIVLNTIEGDANLPFYSKLRGGNTRPAAAAIATVSFSVAEEELAKLPVKDMTNDYAVCNYFQVVDRPENAEFVRLYRARYGPDRVTSDAVVTAYNSVRLWAQAVREAETPDTGPVRDILLRQSLNAPEGVISVDRDTHHTWRPFFVGKVRPDGQVEIRLATTKPIRPMPFPLTRSRREWEAFLDDLYAGWGRSWVAPAARRGS